MIELARHIEILLLNHDCVMVPGFGGFLTNYVEAVVPCEDNATLVPPQRTLFFNQALQGNDGLLVQSYMQAYDAAYPEASKQMQLDISEMDSKLKTAGYYFLNHLGKLSIDLQHHITFEPVSHTILTPRLYSLPMLPMLSVAAAEKERELQQSLAQTTVLPIVPAQGTQEVTPVEVQQESKPKEVTLHPRWIDIAISAAAAVVLFFAFSFSALHQPVTSEPVVVSTATIKAPTAKAHGIDHPTTQQPISKTTNLPNNQSPKRPNDQTTKQPNDQTTKRPNDQTYTLVLASGVRKDNAKDYIKSLAKAGFTDAQFYKDTKMSRVIYGNFPSEETAKTQLQELRKQNDEFKSAFIISLNK